MYHLINKLVDAKFLLRTLGEQIHSGQAKVKDVRKTRKEINSILKEISAMINKEL